MSNKSRDTPDGVADGKDRSLFGWINERIDRLDFSEKEVDSIFNCLLTLIVLCAVISLCLMTFSVRRHILSIFLIPIFAYLLFSSPRFNLRLREYKSLLIITDLMVLIEIFALCLYMDHLYTIRAEDLMVKECVCLIGGACLTAYLCRVKAMFYCSVPVIAGFDMFMAWELGCTVYEVASLGVFLIMVFCWTLYANSFYFGYGRVCLDGVYVHMPEDEARYIRHVQKIMAREQKEKAEAELERRRALQRQKSR